MSPRPDKHWHCHVELVRPQGEKRGERAYQCDLRWEDLERILLKPWQENRPFVVNGLVVPGSAQVAKIKVLQTDDPAMDVIRRTLGATYSKLALFVNERPEFHDFTAELLFGDRALVPDALGATILPIHEIFRATGQPEVTLVEPVQLLDLVYALRDMGRGLVVEGPSGVGKTTAMRTAIDRAKVNAQVRWLVATAAEDCATLDDLIRSGAVRGYLILDEFHRLDTGRQAGVATLMKRLADESRRDAKMVLIGINPVGTSLVQHLPDLGGRFQVVSMTRQPDEKIEELIRKGEQAAAIRFVYRDAFVQAASGSLAVAQLLCQEAALAEGILSTQPSLREIIRSPLDVITKVHKNLDYKYRALLLAFASCDERPPPRGACLALLWQLLHGADASAALHEVRLLYPPLADAFEWLLSSKLAGYFKRNPGLERLFHYNRKTGVLSLEDPQLLFYLRHLDWPAFIRATGHVGVGFSPGAGPVFSERPQLLCVPEPAPLVPSPPAILLHLSDLHFGAPADAALWLEQLLLDLDEQRISRLDAILVSGDIANRASKEEYQAAGVFFQELIRRFSLAPQQVVLTPGNHDLSWSISKNAYRPARREDHPGELPEDRYIEKDRRSDYVEVLEDEARYRERFAAFAEFWNEVRREDYPLDPAQQATIHYLEEVQILILGLNSAWRLDHHYKARTGIHMGALSAALKEIRETPAYGSCRTKIAMWHHPLEGDGDDRIQEHGFIELLIRAGFRLALHGHIHKARRSDQPYSAVDSLAVCGAGTFGAARSEWVSGIPLQYQVLHVGAGLVRVETRCREAPNGAWRPDARWLQAAGQDPKPRYEIALSP